MSGLLRWIAHKYRNAAQTIDSLGAWQAIDFLLLKRDAVASLFGRRTYMLHSKRALHPLRCRRGTSDRDVFRQIFVDREYRCLDDVPQARLVIDCGANCGYSAVYFLSRFPHAYLIAVEPDSSNFEALQENLAPYGQRCLAMKRGIWSQSTGLVVEGNSDFGDGREWARVVRPARAGEPADLEAVEIGDLLAASGHDRVSILKIDIEGSERQVFAAGAPPWLSQVDNMVIEIHGPACHEAVHGAMVGHSFSVSHCDELTVFAR